MTDKPIDLHFGSMSQERLNEESSPIEDIVLEGDPLDLDSASTVLAYGAVDDDIDTSSLPVQGDYLPNHDIDIEERDRDALAASMYGTATDAETGGLNNSGMSDDLTQEELGSGRRIGGPTGGDVYGAGAGSGLDAISDQEFAAEGRDIPVTDRAISPEMQRKIADENMARDLNASFYQN